MIKACVTRLEETHMWLMCEDEGAVALKILPKFYSPSEKACLSLIKPSVRLLLPSAVLKLKSLLSSKQRNKSNSAFQQRYCSDVWNYQNVPVHHLQCKNIKKDEGCCFAFNSILQCSDRPRSCLYGLLSYTG